ncbi:MAG: 3-dehydroquinate dehydratase [Thermoleophilaceae bacterium]|nr:3-dehydroquinate dehydratase [Thermoleophilaceae bacterium]
MRHRIEVLHGVNLDQLGVRPAEHYGSLTFDQLEFKIEGFAEELGLELSSFQTNSEGEFVERLHRAREMDDGLILNPGAWTHYSWAIRDALEISGLPAVEVHLSDVNAREDWRKQSVIRDLCFMTIAGKGIEGYKEALEALAARLEEGDEQ